MTNLKALRIGMAVLVLAMTAFVFGSAAAGAKSRHCYVNTKARYPTMLAPCPRAHIASGASVTFRVRDLNSSASVYHPTLNLSKHGPTHGRLKNDVSAFGIFHDLSPVKGHHGLFSYTPMQHAYPGYWNITPGRYYLQVQQIERACTTPHCTVYSPVTTITIT